jgi:hypothetical protein
VKQWIEKIPIPIKPDYIAWVTGAALKKLLIDSADGFTAVAQPTTDEINHALDLLRMLPGIGYAENASARLTTDDYPTSATKGIVWIASIAAAMSRKARSAPGIDNDGSQL